MPNWKDFSAESDSLKLFLMDKKLYRDLAIIESEKNTIGKVDLVALHQEDLKWLEFLRNELASSSDSHLASSYFRQNKQHFKIYVERILKINLECLLNQHRREVLGIIGQIKNGDVTKKQRLSEMLTHEMFCTSQAVELLKISPDQLMIFDPEFQKRLLADALEIHKDCRLILFTLAFPMDPQDEFNFSQFQKERQDNLFEYFDLIEQYFLD